MVFQVLIDTSRYEILQNAIKHLNLHTQFFVTSAVLAFNVLHYEINNNDNNNYYPIWLIISTANSEVNVDISK